MSDRRRAIRKGTARFASCLVAGCATWAVLYFVRPDAFPPLLGGALVANGVHAMQTKALARAMGRVCQAKDYGRVADVAWEQAGLYPLSRRRRHGAIHEEGACLSAQERFAEALAILETVDRKALFAIEVVGLLNNLAWCKAHLGRATQGVDDAREALRLEAGGPAFMHPFLLGTLGTALVLSGSAQEAVGPLTEALRAGGAPEIQALRSFYLGEALSALGRDAEAKAAYQRAVQDAPKHSGGRRARERLSALGEGRA